MLKKSSPLKQQDNHYLKKQQPSWMEGGAVGHIFERDTHRDHLCQVWALHRWPNLAESIYIRSSIKFLHFVPFRQQIWPPRAILVSDWLMLKKSSHGRTTDAKWWQYLTWPFGSGELKRGVTPI
jgi:hypothetical protein